MRKIEVAKPAAVDGVLAKMVARAREALSQIAAEDEIGDHERVAAEGERVVTHFFACKKPGYVGWHWAVTMSRIPRSRTGTVCEAVLLPGDGALLAPAWVPWAQRLAPGDGGEDDVLPLIEDDPNLMEGYQATGEEDADRLALYELGLGRPRVLAPEGVDSAAKRWNRSRGSVHSIGDVDTEEHCGSCGYLLLLAGSLRQHFGVCANPWSEADGSTVSLNHSCGAHSQTDMPHTTNSWHITPAHVDDTSLDIVEQ